MGIKPRCYLKINKKCEGELKHFGGLLFGPPIGNMVKKTHICVECYNELSKIPEHVLAKVMKGETNR